MKIRLRLHFPQATLLVGLAFAIIAAVGCGEGDSATSASGASQTQQVHRDSGGGSGQFRVAGGDNSIQEFGAEASEAEMQAAGTALHGFLDARAGKKWKTACGYLAAGTTRQLQQLEARATEGRPADCPRALAVLSRAISPAGLREAAIADVGSLRAEGSRGFLLYYGAHGATYAIQVVREGGAWRVSGLTGVPLE